MTQDLKTSLDDLAQTEYAAAPASSIDIGRARADGRRRVLASRLAPLGGGVAVVAACALVVNGLGGASPAKSGSPAPAAGAAAAPRVLTGTDPLTAVAAFGYLPPGYSVTAADGAPGYGPSVVAAPAVGKADPNKGPMTPSKQLMLTSSATQPTFPAYEKLTSITVKGSSKAYLVTNPGDTPEIPADLSLIWQTASGSWFTLGGDYAIHGSELTALLTKVAEGVTVPGRAIPLPFHIEGLPQGLSLIGASLRSPDFTGMGPNVQASVSYRTGDATFSVSVMSLDGAVTSGAPVSPTSAPVSGQPSRPAATNACKAAEGLRVCVVDNPSSSTDALASVGGAQGMLDRITSLGTNPAKWTVHVVN